MSPHSNISSEIIKRIQTPLYWISLLPLDRKRMCIQLLLLIVILFGFGLRIYDLTERPFLADEGISTMAAIDISKTGYPPTMPEGDVYWRSVFHTSTVAVFFQFLGISVFVARLPSVLFGALTILLIYIFGKELMNWKVGIISAFLLAMNVLAIDLSREARMYSMFQFFYLATLYLFYKGFEAKSGKTYSLFKGRIVIENIKSIYLLLSIGTFFISLLCHEGTIVMIFGILGYTIIMGLSKWNKKEKPRILFNKYFELTFLLIILFFVGILFIFTIGIDKHYSSLLSHIGIDLKITFLSIKSYVFYFMQYLPIESCFAMLSLVLLIHHKKKNGAFVVASLFNPLIFQLLFFHYDWITVKYLFHLIPLFLIMSAYGIYETARYLKVFEYLSIRKNILPRYYGIFLSLLLIIAGFSHAYLITHQEKIASPYWREACEYVLINSKNDTSLIASVGIIPYFFLESDEYGLRPDYPEYAHKNITIYDRPYLHTREVLMNFTRTHDNGWVLIDVDRWNWEEVITEDAKLYLQENMTFHPYSYHMYLLIYSWGYE